MQQANSKFKIKKPDIPIAVYIQEAENLYVWCQDDRDKLNRIGISDDFINEIKPLSKKLNDFQTELYAKRNSSSENQKKIKALVIEGETIRSDLIHAFRYLFRNYRAIIRSLKDLKKSKSQATLIQDLFNLNQLSSDYGDILRKDDRIPATIKRSEIVARELSHYIAAKKAEKSSVEIRENRDLAYTELKNVVDEIREAGKFLFKKNEERYLGYCSLYKKKKNRSYYISRKKLPTE